MSSAPIQLCRQHAATSHTRTEINRERYSDLSASVEDVAGGLAGLIGSLGLEGNAGRSADQVLEGLATRLHFQATEIEKLANACQKATAGAVDTRNPAQEKVEAWETANENLKQLQSGTANVPPELADHHARQMEKERENMQRAVAEGEQVINQLDTNTSDAITLLPDFLPPSSNGSAPIENAGVNSSGVGANATATSTLSSSTSTGAPISATQSTNFGPKGVLSHEHSPLPTRIGQGVGHFGGRVDIDPTLLSATSRSIGSGVVSEFSSYSADRLTTLGPSQMTPMIDVSGEAPGASVMQGKASQLGAVVSPALMAAGLPRILKATQMTGNLISLRGATGGSSPIASQGASGRTSIAPTRGSGATTMGARPASAGAGTRASNLAPRARATGAGASTLKSHGGTTAPRSAAATGTKGASAANGSRALSPRTASQGAAGRPVGRAGAQGATARGTSGVRGAANAASSAKGAASTQGGARGQAAQVRGPLGRMQRALGLGRAAATNEKNKDAAPTTERLGERLLDTDSRVNFLGRGQREDIPDTE